MGLTYGALRSCSATWPCTCTSADGEARGATLSDCTGNSRGQCLSSRRRKMRTRTRVAATEGPRNRDPGPAAVMCGRILPGFKRNSKGSSASSRPIRAHALVQKVWRGLRSSPCSVNRRWRGERAGSSRVLPSSQLVRDWPCMCSNCATGTRRPSSQHLYARGAKHVCRSYILFMQFKQVFAVQPPPPPPPPFGGGGGGGQY
mmetsp:Transcript_18177/g.31680  ORF Transcript_18177/g.31680 Transcript_18177/m.31680 type:complete len:202 (+) Transcript_18177:961-1566(+)